MEKQKYDWRLFFYLSVGILLIQIVYAALIFSNNETLEKMGQFGDMFGGLTALFSGLAFAGMITALVLQTKELGLQRDELKLSRKAHENAANSQSGLVEKQLLTAQIQGVGFLLDSYLQAAQATATQGSKSGTQGMYEKANEFNKILIELLEQSGLEVKPKES